MSLPSSGQLSLFAIFAEIYGRQPNVGEQVSFHDLVAKSNLADKSFPCPFSRFYGYTHTAENMIQVYAIMADTSLTARATYNVASNVTISVAYNSASGAKVVLIAIPNGSRNETIILPDMVDTNISIVGLSPASDSAYVYNVAIGPF